MKYEFLVDSYASERLKVLSAWSEFRNEDLSVRPNRTDPRGRSVHEHMVHQCVSEDLWFRNMLGIDVGAPPLPGDETRFGFIKQYRGGQRQTARKASADRRPLVGAVHYVLRCVPVAGMDSDSTINTHIASSRPANGYAADDGSRAAQQLRTHR